MSPIDPRKSRRSEAGGLRRQRRVREASGRERANAAGRRADPRPGRAGDERRDPRGHRLQVRRDDPAARVRLASRREAPAARRRDRGDPRANREQLRLRRPLAREGGPEPRLGHGRGGFPDRGVRQGTGARTGEGRARRRHRRPRLPAGLDRGLAAAEEPRRPQGTRSRVPRRRPRPQARQHRPLAQGAPRRDRGREAQGSAGGARRRPRPQGRRQEHHGLRRVRRPRRHRRPAPRHGHVVGTRRAPLRGREGGRGDRGEGPEVRRRVGTDLARDEAAQARSVARPSGTLPGRRARPRQGRLADGLRRLRGAGRRASRG